MKGTVSAENTPRPRSKHKGDLFPQSRKRAGNKGQRLPLDRQIGDRCGP